VDQIFDRFGTLLKSLWNQDKDPFGRSSSEDFRSGSPGDPDLDDAMDELDAFLKNDKQGQERLERERQRRREQAEQEAHRRFSSGSSGRTGNAGPSSRLAEDYKALGLAYGAPIAEVKTAYKRLLKQHHPDRHGGSPEAQKRATEYSARLNEAYAHIESWIATGKSPEE